MDYREQIVQLGHNSPLLPNTVAKALNTNGILAGAMLSEMVAKGLLKTSALKVGGSPLYYLPGKEEQLLSFSNYLNEKDKRTLALLQELKVIREKDCEPLVRVSLSLIKDFSKQLIVEYNGIQETFYKYFLVTDEEAKQLIKAQLEPVQEVKEETSEIKEETKGRQESKQEVNEIKEEIKEIKQEAKEEITPLKKEKTEKPKKIEAPAGDFWEQLISHFSTHKITIQEHTVVKKKTDFDLIVEIPSPVGKLTYYCKARSKKKLTDADISSAYVTGQIKKLPTIFITDGELNKKAQELASQLKGLTVTQLPWALTSKTSSSENQ
jgi:hypothetical protein